VATRGGRVEDGVIFHSDRGSQYTSTDFGDLCTNLGVVQSMGATGVCWDNSVAESWFGTMKRELANRRRWATRAEARRDLMRWIEGWYTRAGCTPLSTTTHRSTTKLCSTVAATASPHNQPVRRTGSTTEIFACHNCQQRHSGIGFHTPASVYFGTAGEVRRHRAVTLDAAFAAHPERFVAGPPRPPELPETVYINPPQEAIDTH
jgi:hypothetical protein